MANEYSYIVEALNDLFREQKDRIFGSEADFQFALAWQIQRKINQLEKNAVVHLEYEPYEYNADMHVDIVVEDGKALIPIELKYKTKALPEEIEKQVKIKLKKQGAEDCARYDFLKDIERIEHLKYSGKYHIPCGYAVFLTNDHLFWANPVRYDVCDKEFRLHEFDDGNVKHELQGIRNWKTNTSLGTTKNREACIDLKLKYCFHWHTDYQPLNQNFRYTIATIE